MAGWLVFHAYDNIFDGEGCLKRLQEFCMPVAVQWLDEFNADFESVYGRKSKHFFCPILLRDEPAPGRLNQDDKDPLLV